MRKRIDALVAKLPAWVPNLGTGRVFGKRKEKLIIEIIELDGIDLLKSRCGLRFDVEVPLPSNKLKISELLAIKRESMRKQAAAALVFASAVESTPESQILIKQEDVICILRKVPPKRQ